MNKTAFILLTALVLAACGRDQEPPAQPASPPPQADAAAGRAIAEAKCVNCHGLDGRGAEPLIPHLAGQKQEYLQLALREYRSGERSHAALQQLFSELSESGLNDVAAFYAHLPSFAPARAAPAASTDALAAGRTAAGACASCHGADGNAAMPGMPSLAGQHRDYLIAAMQAYKDETRKHAVMNAQMSAVDAMTMQNLAAYYAAQTSRRDQAPTTLSAREWAERCDRCHGPGTDNPSMVVPRIEGQQREYLAHVLRDYRDGKRHQSAMHAMGMPLTDNDIEAIAAHYAAMRSH